MGISGPQAVMVGDSWEKDIAGAVAAGIDAVWLHPGHAKRAPCESWGAVKSISSGGWTSSFRFSCLKAVRSLVPPLRP
ncbi:HAD hydrolase-like protein [Paenibacillus sp. CC-CFT747]|nr:HAD hydrolase-like protein [Paenibacillus sp. CC-CFT747]